MSRSQLALTDQDWHHLHVLWEYLCVESRLPVRADAIVIGGAGAMIDSAERAAELYHAGALAHGLWCRDLLIPTIGRQKPKRHC